MTHLSSRPGEAECTSGCGPGSVARRLWPRARLSANPVSTPGRLLLPFPSLLLLFPHLKAALTCSVSRLQSLRRFSLQKGPPALSFLVTVLPQFCVAWPGHCPSVHFPSTQGLCFFRSESCTLAELSSWGRESSAGGAPALCLGPLGAHGAAPRGSAGWDMPCRAALAV